MTAGDVVFYGTMDGWFKAVDARNGKLLWQFKTGSGIIGQPITYKGPDGKQYIAVMSWRGRLGGRGGGRRLNTVDGTGALGFINAMTDLGKYTTKAECSMLSRCLKLVVFCGCPLLIGRFVPARASRHPALSGAPGCFRRCRP